MARSFHHNPIFGITTAVSEKSFKRIANRRVRSRQQQAIRQGNFDTLPQREVLYNPRDDGPKDGKRFVRDVSAKDMRK